MAPKLIAGIGSRETPDEIACEMIAIGRWCQQNKIWVRSGHAPGADQAFEIGAKDYCIAYLPWFSFGDENYDSQVNYKTPEDWGPLYEHARQFHPAWDKLKDSVKKLIARDSCQVLGLNLNSPVDTIVCWTKDGKATGGTGQALRIAAKSNIPVINMYFEQYNTAAKVIAKLKEYP